MNEKDTQTSTNLWIVSEASLKEVVKESANGYEYIIIAGLGKGSPGWANKNLTDYSCKAGRQRIIDNSLEAYYWEYMFSLAF